MAEFATVAPSPQQAPVPSGTSVTLDPDAKFLDRDLIAGGSPWRLLRLPGGARAIAERWMGGDVVQPGEERFARTLVQQGLLHPRFEATLDVNDVDVVIPVLDDVAALRTLLASLRGLHVTVIDDGSLDATLLHECAQQFGAALERLGANVGPGGARNAGLRATQRPFLWFIDVDITLDNAALTLDRLGVAFADPLVAAVAPRVRGAGGATLRDQFEQRFSPLDMGLRSALVLPGGAVGFVPSACLLTRRSALGEGFDEALRVGEDVDLVWRLHDQGWMVRYYADVVVTHRARSTWPQWWRQRVQYGTSAGALAVRHGDRLAPLRADVWTLVAWASVAARQPVVAARIARLTRDALRERLPAATENADAVASVVVARGMVGSGGPLVRSTIRTYGPLVLVAAFHPKLRRRALALFALGTAWRWQREPVRVRDIPLGIADDAAYGVGVWRGAWRARSWRAVTPHFTQSSLTLRQVLGLSRAQNPRTPRFPRR